MNKLSIFLLTIFYSCSFSKYPVKWENKGIAVNQSRVFLKTGGQGKKLRVVYTGCGGLVMDDGTETIATDPFFSNQPFMSIQLGKIRTKPGDIDLGLKRLNDAGLSADRIKHVFIEHSHYDHLMDLPWLLK
jgi:glyoxylase-like metal-dependent hydrolase (beta-lactamase superfamily II)